MIHRVAPFMALFCLTAAPLAAGPHPAIDAFNTWCFKAGQTETQARANMKADSAAFTLTFWDDSLEPRPAGAPDGVERRCEIAFEGDHTAQAITALRTQMATPRFSAPPSPCPTPMPQQKAPR